MANTTPKNVQGCQPFNLVRCHGEISPMQYFPRLLPTGSFVSFPASVSR